MIWILIIYMSESSIFNKWGHGGPLAIEFKSERECLVAAETIKKKFGNVDNSLCLGKAR